MGSLPVAHATEGHANMVGETSTGRSDEQLESILYETANWTVNGDQGVVLREIASLRLAIEEAARLAARGREVVALMRRRSPAIVVLSDQIRAVTNRLAGSPGVTGHCPEAFVNGTKSEFDGNLSGLIPYGAAYHDVTVPATISRK